MSATREISIDQVLAGADDVLRIVGTIDGTPVEAYGWVSATTNHFEPDAYAVGDDGELVRRDDAEPRTMTRPELLAYAAQLLDEQNSPAPVDLLAL